jgi:hypothetical protein
VIAARPQLDRTDLSLARTVWLSSLVLWVAVVAGALGAGVSAAVGAALGGAIILALFAIHLLLARAWLRSGAQFARVCLWALCCLKWPLVGLALFAGIRADIAAPVWICVGASVVPIVATAAGLLMLRRPVGEGGAR